MGQDRRTVLMELYHPVETVLDVLLIPPIFLSEGD